MSFFFGSHLGLSRLSASNAGEPSKTGYLFDLHVTPALYTRNWVYDLSLAWQHVEASGSIGNSTTTVIASNASLGVSPRYRLNPYWELGPTLDFVMGSNTAFSHNAESSGAHIFGGAKLAYVKLNVLPQFRFGAKVSTDLTIKNRQVLFPVLFAELGFPITKGKLTPREEPPPPAPVAEVAPEARQAPVPAPPPTPTTAPFVFNSQVVRFESAKSNLDPKGQRFFRNLGVYLAGHPKEWDSLRVTGHTDSIGGADSNVPLSQARANEVATVLKRQGVPADRITAEGVGATQPVVTGSDGASLAKNRRVELQFGEGTDFRKMQAAIDAAR